MLCGQVCAGLHEPDLQAPPVGKGVLDGDVGMDVPDICGDRPCKGEEGSEIFGSGRSRRAEERQAFVMRLHLVKGKNLGAGLDLSEGSCLRVNKIDAAGPIGDHNKTARPEEQVRVGDFIVAVGDVAGDARSMMLALHTGGELQVGVRRPQTVVLKDFPKIGSSLGLDLSYHPKSASLVVKQVMPGGAVGEWNKTANEVEQIRIDDHIISVNGFCGAPGELHERLRSDETLDITISRPVP